MRGREREWRGRVAAKQAKGCKTKFSDWAVVVAQLAEQSVVRIQSSATFIEPNFLLTVCRKDKIIRFVLILERRSFDSKVIY